MQLRPLRHRRFGRVALHLVGITALAGSCVLLTSAPGHAAADARPDSYGGESTSSALHFLADRSPQPTPVADLFHAELPYATSSFDSSGTATAAAATLFPGAGLLGVPGLLCQAGACLPVPFDYPLMATASNPTEPDGQAQASPGTQQLGPLSIAGNLTTAHADANRVEGTAKAGATDVNGVLTAESSTAHSTQAFEGGTLVVTAETSVTGLDLGGGQLHIDEIRSVAVAHVDGLKVLTSSAVTTVTGATAGGQAVTIDSSGVHVLGNGDGGALEGSVNSALAQLDAAGITVRMTTPTKDAKDGIATAATGGLLVTFGHSVDLPLPPLPPLPGGIGVPSPNGDYFGSVTVAGAGVTAFASPPLDFSFPEFEVPLAPFGEVPGTPAVPATTSLLGGAAPGPGSVTASTSGPASTVAVPRARPTAVLGVDLTSDRLQVLALVLLGYPALVLLSGPLLRGRPRTRATENVTLV